MSNLFQREGMKGKKERVKHIKLEKGENEDNLSDGLVNEPHFDVGHHENEQPILGTFDGLGSLNVETRNQNHCNYDFDSYVRENVSESDVGYLNGVGFDVGVSDNWGGKMRMLRMLLMIMEGWRGLGQEETIGVHNDRGLE
ncbi:hypothetical protein GH714_006358 [Hevea brasiliensis]|uniref:Uncharacterized protein n=1 Tax=Hevea brasiliensis TaxID=3981 RepID=A0A6A6MX69_HEVBR|nr:hypothetical protein GH714_006358 [Hevea brasiliensis]